MLSLEFLNTYLNIFKDKQKLFVHRTNSKMLTTFVKDNRSIKENKMTIYVVWSTMLDNIVNLIPHSNHHYNSVTDFHRSSEMESSVGC